MFFLVLQGSISLFKLNLDEFKVAAVEARPSEVGGSIFGMSPCRGTFIGGSLGLSVDLCQ